MVRITLLRYGLSVVWISTLVNYIHSGESVMIPYRKKSFWYLVGMLIFGLVIILSLTTSQFSLLLFLFKLLLLIVIGALILLLLANLIIIPDKEDTL